MPDEPRIHSVSSSGSAHSETRYASPGGGNRRSDGGARTTLLTASTTGASGATEEGSESV